MDKANPSQPNSIPPAAPPLAPRRRLWRWLLVAVLAVAASATGFWIYQSRLPRDPVVPTIDLHDVDPEIADAITKARADVVQTPRSADAWGKLAMVLHGNGFLELALKSYGIASDLDRDDPRWPYLQGMILRNGDDPPAALPYFEKASALTPVNSLPTAKLAESLVNQGRLDEAADYYQKVLAASPGEGYAQLGMGQLSIIRRQYKEALGYLDPVVENPYCRKRVCILRITAFQHLNDQAALEKERHRLRELPDDAAWPDVAMEQVTSRHVGLLARLDRAARLARRGRVDESVALLKTTVEAYPKAHTAWGFLGKALAEVKDDVGAEAAFQKAIALAPPLDQAEHWFFVGVYRQQQRRFKDAAAAFRQTVGLRPLDAVAHYSLGECLEEQGDHQGAAEAYRQALRHRPDMTQAQERLAQILKRQ